MVLGVFMLGFMAAFSVREQRFPGTQDARHVSVIPPLSPIALASQPALLSAPNSLESKELKKKKKSSCFGKKVNL